MRSLLCIVAIAGLVLIPSPLSADEPSGERPSCIEVTTRAQFSGYGYNHIVRLHNTCTTVATCQVSTDVNPAPVTVHLAVGQASEVLTFRGSPASAFHARAQCTLSAVSR